MDQVQNKRSVWVKTQTENGEVDIQHLLQNNPKLREKIKEHANFGEKGLTELEIAGIGVGVATVLGLLPGAMAVVGALFSDNRINYQISKNPDEYRLNPRRDKNTRGRSKEHERGQYRDETQRDHQPAKRTLALTANLEQSLAEKHARLSEMKGEEKFDRGLQDLQSEKIKLENELNDFKSAEKALEVEIGIKDEELTVKQREINELEQVTSQLRSQSLILTKESAATIGMLLKMIKRQQKIRDEKSQHQLAQSIASMKLKEYARLHPQYHQAYQEIKNFLDQYKVIKQAELHRKQQEKAEIESELNKLKANLSKNRKQLIDFEKKRYALLQEDVILSGEALHKTQQVITHVHQEELTYITDEKLSMPWIQKRWGRIIDETAFVPFFIIEAPGTKISKFNEADKNINDMLISKFAGWTNFDPFKIFIDGFKEWLNTAVGDEVNYIDKVQLRMSKLLRGYQSIQSKYINNFDTLSESIIQLNKQIKAKTPTPEMIKLIDNFSEGIELISIEKKLDKLGKYNRNQLVQNLKLIQSFLIKNQEEKLFTHLPKNFLSQLASLKKDLPNNALLIGLEQAVRDIRAEKYAQKSYVMDHVERLIDILESDKVFRLESCSIDFHCNNLTLTFLEEKMLEYNKAPSFDMLLELINIFGSTLKERNGKRSLNQKLGNDENFLTVVIANFEHFIKSNIPAESLQKFANEIGEIPSIKNKTTILKKIKLVEKLNYLKKINLPSKRLNAIENNIYFVLLNKEYIEFINTDEEDIDLFEKRLQVVTKQLQTTLISQSENKPSSNQIILEGNEEKKNDKEEDNSFIGSTLNEIGRIFNNKENKLNIETSIKYMLYQAFTIQNESNKESELKKQIKFCYKQQVEFVLAQSELIEFPEKLYFMLQALFGQDYYYDSLKAKDQSALDNILAKGENINKQSYLGNSLFALDYIYYKLQIDYEMAEQNDFAELCIRLDQHIKRLCYIVAELTNEDPAELKQRYDKQCLDLENKRFKLKVKGASVVQDIIIAMQTYVNKQKDDAQLYSSLSEVINTPNLIKVIEEIPKAILNNISDRQQYYFTLIKAIDLNSLPDPFITLSQIRQAVNNTNLKDFNTIINTKFIEICEVSKLHILAKLENLSEKLDRINVFIDIVNQVLEILGNEQAIETTKKENYSKLENLIMTVELHFEKQLQFNANFHSSSEKLEDNSNDNCQGIKDLADQILNEEIHNSNANIRFIYKNETRTWSNLKKLFKDKNEIFLLKHLVFVDGCFSTDEVMGKVVQYYVKQIEILRRETSSRQLEIFLNSSSKKTNNLSLLSILKMYSESRNKSSNNNNNNNNSEETDKVFANKMLYHLQANEDFKFGENCGDIHNIIKNLTASTKKIEIDKTIIKTLIQKAKSIYLNELNICFKQLLEAQADNISTLSNYKKDIAENYEKYLPSTDKKTKHLQTKLINLHLQKLDNTLAQNQQGNLNHEKRMEVFKRLAGESSNKDHTTVERMIASYLNSYVFLVLKKDNPLNHIVIKTSFTQNDFPANQKSIVPTKEIEEFFDDNARFLVEKANKLNHYLVQVTIDKTKGQYNFSWKNRHDLEQKQTLLIKLYFFLQLKKFNELLQTFFVKISMIEADIPKIGSQLSDILIRLTQILTLVLRANIRGELIRLNEPSEIEEVKYLFNQFSDYFSDTLFPDKESQLIISNFIVAINIFIEEALDSKLSDVGVDKKLIANKNRSLIDLREVLEKLKITLNNKIYKELNYRLVEKEYTEFFEKQLSDPINTFKEKIIDKFSEILELTYLLDPDRSYEFALELRSCINKLLPLYTLKDFQPVDSFLDNQRKTFLTPKQFARQAGAGINIGAPFFDTTIILPVNQKNLIILKIKINENKELMFKEIKSLLKQLFNYNSNMTENEFNTLKIEFEEATLSLVDLYLKAIRIKRLPPLLEKKQDEEYLTKVFEFADTCCKKLSKLFLNNKASLDLGDLENIFIHILNSEFDIEDIEKKTDQIILKMIQPNFDIFQLRNVEDYVKTLPLLDELSPRYFTNKQDKYKSLMQTLKNLLGKGDHNFKRQYLENYWRYCSLYSGLDDDEEAALLRLTNNVGSNFFNTIVDCLDSIEKTEKRMGQNRVVSAIMPPLEPVNTPAEIINSINSRPALKIENKKEKLKWVENLLNTEERKLIEAILALVKDDERVIDKILATFSEPVVVWQEMLVDLRIECLLNKIAEKFSIKGDTFTQFKNCIKQSRFFASSHLEDWFDILYEIATNSASSLTGGDIVKIINYLSDFDDLSLIKKKVKLTSAKWWPFNILYTRFETNLMKLVLDKTASETVAKLFQLKQQLQSSPDKGCQFLEIFGYHILEYQHRGSLTLDSKFSEIIFELLDLVMESQAYRDDVFLDNLRLKPLTLWKLPLEKKKISRTIKTISMFNQLPSGDQDHAVNCLYKIGEEKGKVILDKLATLFKDTQGDSKSAIALLEQLAYGDYNLDNDILEKLKGLKKAELSVWIETLKVHTQSQFRDLSVAELLSLMQEKAQAGAINESIKNLIGNNNSPIKQLLAKINHYYGEPLHKSEQATASSTAAAYEKAKICVELSHKYIKDWNRGDILQWANELRKTKQDRAKFFSFQNDYLAEIIAVISAAVKLFKGYLPRNTQLIALAIFLDSSVSNKGRLGNIYTGEGKTLVTAMLAIAQVLIGEKVDIVTSSKVLAIRDASADKIEGYKELYEIFGLKVSNNCDDACDAPGLGESNRKERYQQNDVIYGETGYFQRDILLTNFFDKQIRDRIGDSLIVDEVDNMVIDNAEKTLYISHSITDMRHIRDLFIQIWAAVNNNVEHYYSEDNVDKIYNYIQKMIENTDLHVPETLRKFVDGNLKNWIINAYTAKYIETNDNYIIGDSESNKHGEVLIMDKETGVEQMSSRWSNGLHQFLQLKHSGKLSDESLKAVFMSNMSFFKKYCHLNGMTGTIGGKEERSLLSMEYGVDCFELPRFRKHRYHYEKSQELVCGSQEEWCQEIIANIDRQMNVKRNVNDNERKQIADILLELGQSKQGIIMRLVELTKELAIEKVKLDKLDITIKDNEKAKANLIEKEKKTPSDIIKGEGSIEDCDKKINEAKQQKISLNSKIKEFEDKIALNTALQKQYELDISNYQKILAPNNDNSKRAVLVICENIAKLETIATRVVKKFKPKGNNIYTYDRAYRKFEKNELNSGDIIIATNIAGRGTDLGIDVLLEANGGLEVILSYIPPNLRISDQAFGRGARAGKRGSGVYIVFDERKASFMPDITVDDLLDERDEKEKERLYEVVTKSFPKIKLEDELFERFNQFKQQLKSQIEKKLANDDEDDALKQAFIKLQLQGSLQNHWAFWLNKMEQPFNQVYLTGKEPLLEKFMKFKNKILTQLINNEFGLISEPGELVKLGKLYLDHEKYEAAQKCYDKVIQSYPNFAEIAHYYKAFCIVNLNGGDSAGKSKLKEHLKKSLALLENRRSTIMSRNQIMSSLNQLSQNKGIGLNVNYFKRQNEGDAQVLTCHINAILETIGSEVTAENFRSGKIVGDEPNKVYLELLQENYELIKDNRISKKIVMVSKVLKTTDNIELSSSINGLSIDMGKVTLLISRNKFLAYSDFKKTLGFNHENYKITREILQKRGILGARELRILNKNETLGQAAENASHITFPNRFSYCQEAVLDKLELVLIHSEEKNSDYKSRIIKDDYFEKQIFHREIFLEKTKQILETRNVIKISDDIKDKLVGKLDDPVFLSKGDRIKALLLGKEPLSLQPGDSISYQTFIEAVYEKLGESAVDNSLKVKIEVALRSLLGNTVEMVQTISEDLKSKMQNSLDGIITSQTQTSIHQLLEGKQVLRLSPGAVISRNSFLKALKSFFTDSTISDEKIQEILTYIENHQVVAKPADFSENASDDIYLEPELSPLKFIDSQEEYYFKPEQLDSIKDYLSKLSFNNLKEVDKSEIEGKIKNLDFSYFSTLNNKKTLIKELLLKEVSGNKNGLTQDDFKIKTEEFELLRAILQDNGILTTSLYDHLSKNRVSIKENLTPELDNILFKMYSNGGKIFASDLALRSANEVSKELWLRLRETNVIKEAHVNFKLTNDPDKRIEAIQQQVEIAITKALNLKRESSLAHALAEGAGLGGLAKSEYKNVDEYIDTITTVLKQAAGTLKTFAKVKIEEKNIKQMFESGKVPPELMDYVGMCFDSVISLKEDKSFWDWDAFACVMIGVAQIVAAVAIEVYTLGSGHLVAQALIQEGIGDVIFAIQSLIQGNFSWKAYSQHKIQSLMVTLLTTGVTSYFSKASQGGKMALGVATKSAIFRTITTEAFTQLVNGVAMHVVNITTEELSKLTMNELFDKHFVNNFDKWMKEDAGYQAKILKIKKDLVSVYKKFGAKDAANNIQESMQAALLDLKQGNLGNIVANKVTQIVTGISKSFAKVAGRYGAGNNKAAVFSSIAKIIDKTVSVVEYFRAFTDLFSVCDNFCDLFNKKLLDILENKKPTDNLNKIRTENTNISITGNIAQHIKDMEANMSLALKNKVKDSFLRPGIQFALNNAVQSIKEAITAPFNQVTHELKRHVQESVDHNKETLLDYVGQEVLVKLTETKKRALGQLGLLGQLIDVVDLNPAVLEEKLFNLAEQSVAEVIRKYGDGIKLTVKYGKFYGLVPTYKEIVDNIHDGLFAGSIQVRLVEESYSVAIEIVDPQNLFQLHKDFLKDNIFKVSPIANITHDCKKIKIAYVKAKQNSKGSYFAPVIEEEGEYKVVDLAQLSDTKDKGFAQTMVHVLQTNLGIPTDIEKFRVKILANKQFLASNLVYRFDDNRKKIKNTLTQRISQITLESVTETVTETSAKIKISSSQFFKTPRSNEKTSVFITNIQPSNLCENQQQDQDIPDQNEMTTMSNLN